MKLRKVDNAFDAPLFPFAIVMQSPGVLGLEGDGQAPRWRLTELGLMKEGALQSPTRDFMNWDGTVFKDANKKTETRAGNPAHPVLEIQHTPVPEIQHAKSPDRAGNPAQRDSGEVCRKSSTELVITTPSPTAPLGPVPLNSPSAPHSPAALYGPVPLAVDGDARGLDQRSKFER